MSGNASITILRNDPQIVLAKCKCGWQYQVRKRSDGHFSHLELDTAIFDHERNHKEGKTDGNAKS